MAREAQPAGNGFDKKVVQGYIDRVENLKEEIASIMGTAMNEAKSLHEDIAEVFKEAKSNGIPLKALKAQLKLRKLDRDKEKVVAGLDEEDAESLEKIQHALGLLADTPLGGAAMKAAEARGASAH